MGWSTHGLLEWYDVFWLDQEVTQLHRNVGHLQVRNSARDMATLTHTRSCKIGIGCSLCCWAYVSYCHSSSRSLCFSAIPQVRPIWGEVFIGFWYLFLAHKQHVYVFTRNDEATPRQGSSVVAQEKQEYNCSWGSWSRPFTVLTVLSTWSLLCE